MKTALPYRSAASGAVRAGTWSVDLDGTRVPLPKLLETWDYATPLDVRRQLSFSLEELRDASGLPTTARLSAGALWSCRPSALRGPSALHPIDASGEIELRLELSGQRLGGTLELETVVLLAEAIENRHDRAPWRAGSILWSDRTKCRLQGDAPLFPIAIVDFAALGYDDRAPWILQVEPDLNAPAAGAIYLLVNDRASDVIEALKSAGSPDPMQAAILSALHHDVGRTLSEAAISNTAVGSGVSFEQESLGDVLQGLLAVAFPRQNLQGLRTMRETDPATWAGQTAAAFGLFPERNAP